MSKWIEFQEAHFYGKTKLFNIATKDSGALIGQIKWYAPWRKYSFFPHQNTVFETDCLRDICQFIDTLMLDRKIEKQNAALK